NAPLRAASVTRAMRARINSFDPFTAFRYWRRLWQYDEAMRERGTAGAGVEWNATLDSIQEILLQAFPAITAWLLSWFYIGRCAADDFNFRNSDQAIAAGIASSVVLIAFWCA